MSEINKLVDKIVQFSEERDWHKFHTPKELAISISIEANELLECFQWKTEEDVSNLSDEEKTSIGDEIADVLNYLLLLSYELDIDPIEAAEKKIIKNGLKYPADKCRGKADKYTAYIQNENK
jgi:NTP pyrophosphatase (non-canonical NTP hydrolase)